MTEDMEQSVDLEFDPITGVCLTCGDYHLAGECPEDDDVKEREARETEERVAIESAQAEGRCPGCGAVIPDGCEAVDMDDNLYCPECGTLLADK